MYIEVWGTGENKTFLCVVKFEASEENRITYERLYYDTCLSAYLHVYLHGAERIS